MQKLEEIREQTKAEVSGEKEARAAVESKLADASKELEMVRPQLHQQQGCCSARLLLWHLLS